MFHADPQTLGGPPRATCVVALVATAGDRVVALGEAKWRPLTLADLERLRHIRDIAPNADGARLLLYMAHAADRQLSAAANAAGDVQLVDLERLYTGDRPGSRLPLVDHPGPTLIIIPSASAQPMVVFALEATGRPDTPVRRPGSWPPINKPGPSTATTRRSATSG